LVLALGLTTEVAKAATNNQAPIADAGLSRYAAQNPVVLDGTGSYDPDNSGTLSYTWRPISGPSVVIVDANTTTPTISGFVQTDEIQECQFELVVSDAELTSLPDTVKVIIVPDFGENKLRLANDSFDPDKPTCVFFWGGNCISGVPFQVAWASEEPAWLSKANIIEFSKGYEPDPNYTPGDVDALRTYYRCGDMIIVFLSSVAPDYKMPIQTMGFSTGGQPAIDVGIHLNLMYADARYAVNRVTLLDARACRDFSDSIRQFLSSSVNGEQCWIDNHRGNTDGPYPSWPSFYPNVLRVGSSLPHMGVPTWYANSLTRSDMNQFNQGVVGGAYWSVIGSGRNLQLASTPDIATYSFTWHGGVSSGYMDFYDESNHPGRLPEPVTLIGPSDGAVVDANGVVLSCEISENAIGYQLLFGSEPYRVMDYMIVSDTPGPPSEVITSFPYEQTWWTVRVYDAFGSTIYADPICIYPEKVEAPEPNLVAYWKLDEIEGMTAHDTVGNNDATLFGDPIWQPDGGMVDGALAFDGIDDYVNTPFVSNARLEPFSMFAWMKSDSNKYQVVISQKAFWNLLAVDSEGNLMTSAWASDYGKFIYSDEKITFGQWHHVGLVWDGRIKSVYLDGIEVAQAIVTDAPAAGVHGNTELNIGTSLHSKTYFFSGLIDDVRIYNRAVTP
jgi:hypothetical protein